MDTKKTADLLPRAEARVLQELAADTHEPDVWLTPAFWTMATAAATNLVAVASLVGWVKASEVESLTQALVALVGAAQVIIVNTVLVWKYIAGQNELQVKKITAKYKYIEAVTVERMRAR